MEEKTVQKFLRIFLVLATPIVIGSYLYWWQFGFNSDYALIGLMAKSILDRGHIPNFEWPIFVWKVGYNGIFIEVYAIALTFWLFGVSPWVHNLAPSLFFLVMMYFFYQVTKISFGKITGLLATVLLIVGSPYLFHKTLRTQPNYVETFALGLLLIWVYMRWIEKWYLHGKPWKSNSFRDVSFLGLIAGFGLYTYGQMVYFIACVGIHFLMVQWQIHFGPSKKIGPSSWVPTLFFPRFLESSSRGAQLLWQASHVIALVLLATGIASFFLMTGEIRVGDVQIKWDPVSMIRDSIFLLAVFQCPRILFSIPRKDLRFVGLLGGILGIFFLIGFSPSLYYSLVLGLKTAKKFGTHGNLSSFTEKLSFAYQGALDYLNLISLRPWKLLAAWWVVLSLGFLTIQTWKRVSQFLATSKGRADPMGISPLLFLPPITLGAYCVSVAASDLYSARYTVAVLFVCLIAQAAFLEKLYFLKKLRYAKSLAISGLSILLINNSYAIYDSIKSTPNRFPLLDVADYLKAQQVNYAYGDYWYAYAITFLTNEEIVIEPTYSNYCPYYGPLVRKAKKIALIEPLDRVNPKFFPVHSINELDIDGRAFRILETKKINDAQVRILEAKTQEIRQK